jgi:hypothetical protein
MTSPYVPELPQILAVVELATGGTDTITETRGAGWIFMVEGIDCTNTFPASGDQIIITLVAGNGQGPRAVLFAPGTEPGNITTFSWRGALPLNLSYQLQMQVEQGAWSVIVWGYYTADRAGYP